MQADAGRLVVAGVLEEADDGVVVAVEELGGVLAVCGGHTSELLDGKT
ncbi:hypothetical protein OG609_44855 (plasmid) [Streptomyces sp. NBC_01224]|nr:hypothetical protein OG609_44855 [Streptomyces sp. NBC_01224]